MKLVVKNPETFLTERLSVTKKEIPCLDSSWHYHAQYELLYISKSNGIRFVGDNVAPFFPGDLVLVGAWLPHLWRNDLSYIYNGNHKHVKTIVLKFQNNFIGEHTFDNPEFLSIRQLLEESRFGISFGKTISQTLHRELLEIVDLSLAEQSIKLLSMLHRLSLSSDRKILSSTDMRQFNSEPTHRIDAVLKYISDNYAHSIRLNDVADIACMTNTSFCRFFKRMTNKSFTQFLSEVRIRNASRLLIQDNLPVSEVAYRVGFNSITNFNRQFKQIIGSTPKNYRIEIVEGLNAVSN